ncbi:50S ribosomal protein L5 [Gammaproteobacteria bacterium]|nr:50S ribosomal protein L5 [Gammaproteobacteria bacterium]
MNLKDRFNKEIAPQLKEKLGCKSIMEVPKLTKITINMGVGEASKDKGVLENAVKDLEAIAGQKVVVTKARKAVASFKIREEYPIGCKVTLRGDRMYDFFERLVDLAIPREKDFRGLSEKSFDGKGNYNMGVKEQIIFPEIDYDKVDKLRGMDIAITTSAKDDSSAKELLQSFNFPFRGKNG